MLREEINRALAGEVAGGTDLLSHLAHLGLGYLVQQALEQEQEDFLGRARYERRGGEGPGIIARPTTATATSRAS